MIVSMQGNWTVSVKAKNAAFPQRFIIAGAIVGNGVHAGTPGTSVAVFGSQWTIAIQNDPGTGFQLSDAQIKFPRLVGSNYEFDVGSNDAGADKDFDDLILTCSTPSTINDFIIYGNVSLYSGRCIFNPCRRGPFVIETPSALLDALKNSRLRELIEKLYPERIPGPIPPDPGPFKPIVIDVLQEAQQPKTVLTYQRLPTTETKLATRAAEVPSRPEFAASNFSLRQSLASRAPILDRIATTNLADIAQVIDGISLGCQVSSAPGLTLTFEEYDRTTAELAGSAYTGTGNRQLLGDTITDMNGNYIFRFSFDMTLPGLAEGTDVAAGEDISVVAFPDIIVKVTAYSPANVIYESAPYYNIANLRRIDLCLPKSSVQVSSACFNGNLIGSLGNVFVGGNQNSTASSSAAALTRHGYNNFLEADGVVTVHSSLAGFSVDCAAWTGTIDMKGCMYDLAKTAAQNTVTRYTIRIRRAGTARWEFVSQNYKHPRFSKRNLANYTGDDVGPFTTALHVDGGAAVDVPAYRNIQREIFVDGIDWEFANFDRYMQLNTALYDVLAGVRTPGTFHVRVDGYDAAGHPVANATDMIALFIHNLPLSFQLTGPTLLDPNVVYAGCGLYRLTEAQLNTTLRLSFKANDPYGFVNSYSLNMGRCPGPTLALDVIQPPAIGDTAAGATVLAAGSNASNTQVEGCPRYTGTIDDFADAGLIVIDVQPAAAEGGWIRAGEYYTVHTFALTARMRITNGYNTGLSSVYEAHASIAMERLPA